MKSFDYHPAAANAYRIKDEVWARKRPPADFHLALEHCFPLGFWDNFLLVRSGDSDDLEPLILFLEADPYFFRSGYLKGELLHLLKKRADLLSASQRSRLEEVIIRTIQNPAKREFPWYLRLARRLANPVLVEKIQPLLVEERDYVRFQTAQAIQVIGS